MHTHYLCRGKCDSFDAGADDYEKAKRVRGSLNPVCSSLSLNMHTLPLKCLTLEFKITDLYLKQSTPKLLFKP